MPLRNGKRRRWTVVGMTLIAAAIAVAAIWPRGDAARRAWRDRAVATIERRIADRAWLHGELGRPRAASQPGLGGWVRDELLVMRNGEWIVCQNVCAKEQDAAVKRDLFVGRGSDGTWYYSTFHFCVGKCVLQMERRPDSLAQFVDGYWLRPFDGRSDESLKSTWAGEPYGDWKLQAASAASSSP